MNKELEALENVFGLTEGGAPGCSATGIGIPFSFDVNTTSSTGGIPGGQGVPFAQQICFSHDTPLAAVCGLDIQGGALSHLGTSHGICTETSAATNPSNQRGTATGRLATSTALSNRGVFSGLTGIVAPESLENLEPTATSMAIGAGGSTDADMSLSLGSQGTHRVAGLLGVLDGKSITGGTPGQTCTAAGVIGIDNFNPLDSSVDTWAGCFEGRVHTTGALKSGNSMLFDGPSHRITTDENISIGFEDFSNPFDDQLFPNVKVGIGTLNPATKLHVEGSETNVDIRVQQTGSTAASLRLIGGTGGRDYGLFSTGSGSTQEEGKLVFFDLSQNGDLAVFGRNGNFGIGDFGTPDPTDTLHVKGTARVEVLDEDSDLEKVVVADDDGVFHFRTAGSLPAMADDDWDINNTPHMFAIPTGNVGIGTATPGGKLHVEGSSTNIDVRVRQTGTTAASLRLIGGTGGRDYGLFSTGLGNTQEEGKLVFHDLTQNGDLAVFGRNGNFGIGSFGGPDPTETLHVKGTARVEVLPSSSSNRLVVADTSGVLHVRRANTLPLGEDDDWTITNGTDLSSTPIGRVGIGTQLPSAKLHVADAVVPQVRLEGLTSNDAELRIETPESNREARLNLRAFVQNWSLEARNSGDLAGLNAINEQTGTIVLNARDDDRLVLGQVTGDGALSAAVEVRADTALGDMFRISGPAGNNTDLRFSPAFLEIFSNDAANPNQSKIRLRGLQTATEANIVSFYNGTHQLGLQDADGNWTFQVEQAVQGSPEAPYNTWLAPLNDPSNDVGGVIIGGTLNAPTARLDVVGQARIRELPDGLFTDIVVADVEGRLHRSTAASLMSEPSDRRLKKDIADLPYGLSEVAKLRPVVFSWREEPTRGRQVGLIAQEVRAVVEEVVHQRPDETGTLSINYAHLVPLLVRGMQEQQELIEELQLRVARMASVLEAQELPGGVDRAKLEEQTP